LASKDLCTLPDSADTLDNSTDPSVHKKCEPHGDKKKGTAEAVPLEIRVDPRKSVAEVFSP